VGVWQLSWVNWSLGRARQAGLTGTYWIKWRAGAKPQWAGPFKDEWAASAAQLSKKRELRSGNIPATNDALAISLQTAIDEFLFERSASQDPNSVRCMRKEFSNFATVSKKQLLNQGLDRQHRGGGGLSGGIEGLPCGLHKLLATTSSAQKERSRETLLELGCKNAGRRGT
jgi:hypothetical protein